MTKAQKYKQRMTLLDARLPPIRTQGRHTLARMQAQGYGAERLRRKWVDTTRNMSTSDLLLVTLEELVINL